MCTDPQQEEWAASASKRNAKSGTSRHLEGNVEPLPRVSEVSNSSLFLSFLPLSSSFQTSFRSCHDKDCRSSVNWQLRQKARAGKKIEMVATAKEGIQTA
jgi:hypothetical protein